MTVEQFTRDHGFQQIEEDLQAAHKPKAIHRESILNEANLAICGDRAQAYGPPLDNWTRISTLWNAYIMIREQSEKPGIAPFEVAIFNILTKISRLSHTPNHKDSWVDIAGYAACGAEVSGAE